MDASPIETIADAIDAARPAYDTLLERGEAIDDEWSYVNDLATAWLARIDEVAATRGPEPVGAAVGAAVAQLADEADRIDDPHRAIDWLSTYPQVLLIALGEQP